LLRYARNDGGEGICSDMGEGVHNNIPKAFDKVFQNIIICHTSLLLMLMCA